MKFFRWLFPWRSRALDEVTPGAREVCVVARQEAERLGHAYVGTEHLLLALLAASEGVAAFQRVGIDAALLKEEVERSVQPGDQAGRRRILRCTPRFTQVVRRSGREADRLGHRELRTEHLVLGLLSVRRGVAWKSLKRFPVSLEHARSAFAEATARL